MAPRKQAGSKPSSDGPRDAVSSGKDRDGFEENTGGLSAQDRARIGAAIARDADAVNEELDDNTTRFPGKPTLVQGDFANLPAAFAPLLNERRWVVWKGKAKKGGGLSKTPFQTSPRREARVNDPATWSSHGDALAAFQDGHGDGLGFCLLNHDNLVAVDLDDCRDPETGVIDPWAASIVDKAASYAEVTPSGSGLRILGTGTGAPLHQAPLRVPGTAITVEAWRRPDTGRFITVTGVQLAGAPDRLADIGELVDGVLEALRAARTGAGSGEAPGPDAQEVRRNIAAKLVEAWPPDGARHDAAMTLGSFLARAGWDPDAISEFVHDVATQAGDDEPRDRARAARDMAHSHLKGNKSRGFPALAQAFGVDVADYVAQQLGYDQRAEPVTEEELLAELNDKFCVVRDGGKVRVLSFTLEIQRSKGREVHRRSLLETTSFPDFINFHANRFVLRDRKLVPLGVWWTRHPQRRTYEGLTFQPAAGEVIDGRLNLWRGFGVEPKPGDWSLMRQHIREVLAAGDEAADRYIINWIAWAVQNPDKQAEVALVFIGPRGSGKGALGRAMCQLFGQHATHISSAKHLAGNFNAHLRDACLLFADEAYWPGDRAAEGTLKRLITEPTLFIEAKGKDGRSHPNMLHVIMASNEEWVVPAGEAERRYAVFRTADHRAQDEAWFTPLFAQVENGGYAAMLHDLLALDLEGWHPRRIVRTQALVEQQLQSLHPRDAAWLALLEAGTLWGADPQHPARAISSEYEEEVDVGDRVQLVRRKGLFDQIRSVAPRIRNEHENLLRHILKENGARAARVMRRRGWELPPLAEARAKWEQRFPGWKWTDPELIEWQPPEMLDEDQKQKRAEDAAVTARVRQSLKEKGV